MKGSMALVSNSVSADLNSGLIVKSGESPKVAKRVQTMDLRDRILTNIPINIQSATLSADFGSNESFRENVVVQDSADTQRDW